MGMLIARHRRNAVRAPAETPAPKSAAAEEKAAEAEEAKAKSSKRTRVKKAAKE